MPTITKLLTLLIFTTLPLCAKLQPQTIHKLDSLAGSANTKALKYEYYQLLASSEVRWIDSHTITFLGQYIHISR